MIDLGRRLSAEVSPGQHWHFEGEMGTGKTTLIQGICDGLGVNSPVLSPTFSIFDAHEAGDGTEILHVDLYRIETPGELINTGLDCYERDDCTWFVEWPALGAEFIPEADVKVTIRREGEVRQVTFEAAARRKDR